MCFGQGFETNCLFRVAPVYSQHDASKSLLVDSIRVPVWAAFLGPLSSNFWVQFSTEEIRGKRPTNWFQWPHMRVSWLGW